MFGSQSEHGCGFVERALTGSCDLAIARLLRARLHRRRRSCAHLPLALLLGLAGCRKPPPPADPPDAPLPPFADAPTASSSRLPEPYDLPAALHALTRDAARALGPHTVTAMAGDLFVLAAPAPGPAWDASVKLAKDAIPALFNERFSQRPDRPVLVLLLPTDAAYHAFADPRPETPKPVPRFGFYLVGLREAVVNEGPGITTLTHEIVHPLVDADFPGAPMWLDEGLASLFEAPVIPGPGEIHGTKNWRHAALLRALSSPASKRVRLEALFAMTDDLFRAGDEPLHYAMARAFCGWLDAQGKLWPFYRAWRDGVSGDPRGEHAFASIMGRTPAEATDAWVRWVRAL